MCKTNSEVEMPTRVASLLAWVQVQGREVQVMRQMQVQGHEVKVQGHEVKVQGHGMQVQVPILAK